MVGIYWRDDTGRLKTYSATVKGSKATVKIELEITGHYELSHVLADLEAIEQEQKARAARSRKSQVKRTARSGVRRIEGHVPLLLTDQRET